MYGQDSVELMVRYLTRGRRTGQISMNQSPFRTSFSATRRIEDESRRSKQDEGQQKIAETTSRCSASFLLTGLAKQVLLVGSKAWLPTMLLDMLDFSKLSSTIRCCVTE